MKNMNPIHAIHAIHGKKNAPTRFFTTGEVARLLGVDPATVIRRGNDGTLSYRQIGPRGRRRYHPAELLRLGVHKLAIDAVLYRTEEHGKHGK